MVSLSLLLLSLTGSLVSGAVTVTKTGQGPTGYEVTITYQNASVDSVNITSLPHLTNQYSTSFYDFAEFDLAEFQPGDFPAINSELVYPMTKVGPGNFTFSRPFPGGTFQYAFQLGCSVTNSTISVTDPTNPPWEDVPNTEYVSTFQVPFDAEFQHYADMPMNQDYALPYGNSSSQRGIITHSTYYSPGSILPAPDVHDYVIYFPAGYDNNDTSTKYPLLYLSHGGNGVASDWQNQAYVSNMLDRLIGEGHIAPTVVVMPTWYGILNGTTNPAALTNPGYPAPPTVASLYSKYLFPHIETTYQVTNDSDHRAFAGLSQGSFVTYSFYVNYTSYFGYYGFFSGGHVTNAENLPYPLTDFVNASMAEANPDLLDRGIFSSYGQYDKLLVDAKRLEEALTDIGVKYVHRFTPWGYHFWNTWQDAFWHFGRTALWKPRPFDEYTAHSL